MKGVSIVAALLLGLLAAGCGDDKNNHDHNIPDGLYISKCIDSDIVNAISLNRDQLLSISIKYTPTDEQKECGSVSLASFAILKIRTKDERELDNGRKISLMDTKLKKFFIVLYTQSMVDIFNSSKGYEELTFKVGEYTDISFLLENNLSLPKTRTSIVTYADNSYIEIVSTDTNKSMDDIVDINGSITDTIDSNKSMSYFINHKDNALLQAIEERFN